MNWKTPKSSGGGRFGRVSLLLGVVGVTVGGMVLGAGVAQATVGNDPGAVQLNPDHGPESNRPTWSTTKACKSGFQGSAVFREVHADGTTTNTISPVVNGTAAPFSGTLQGTIRQIQTSPPGGIPNGGTQEFVVVCFSGPSLQGNSDPEMDIAIHYSADGSTYTTDTNFGGGGGGALSTTTALTASPNPANVGDTVTLTATVTTSGGTVPVGTVQFENGSTGIGSPVTVDSTGKAVTTTSFSAAGSQSLSAVFTPTDATKFTTSTGTATETINSSGGGGNSEMLAVTVPSSGGSGFTLTVGSGTVNLTVSGSSATGALNTITVNDTRNPAPGWSISGQAADFTGPATIPGNQLGWAPTDTALATGATLGAMVTPASPGLGTAPAVLASAPSGSGTGTSTLGANMTLAIPAGATPGSYTSTLTLTATTSGP